MGHPKERRFGSRNSSNYMYPIKFLPQLEKCIGPGPLEGGQKRLLTSPLNEYPKMA